MSKESVGFVGVGLMGHGMAKNIMAAGYPLTVIAHRSRNAVEDLVDSGATEVQTLPDLARASSIIHICAPGSPQVEAIIAELLPAMAKGTVVVDCSTSDPGSTEKLAALLDAQGCHLADAPLGGTPVQAEAGQLATMVGATDEIFARLEPVLDAWAGGGVVHLGAIGKGHQMKLLNNFLAMGYAAMYSEALALSEKVGITTAQFDSVIRGSRMDCGFYQTFMGYSLEGNREAHKFTLTNAYKDMRYLASMADGAGIANPVGSAVKNSFALALSTGGDGPEDYVPHLVDYIGKANAVEKA
ncbi:3-hydroxyisobutyrate dehydrogenase [Litoreibacter janthinus]|uniref:3-hydroxyisobutyrate dehydrogenase n=2 Tax=Litoreibacter janthinus TaxID=670154 RepID=A0A1I6GSA9_9RHOB|nr:3-hydroxyisobutyrate dehydrogenase [Litoreibacter janthinus]